ncbi:MAG TPA: helix-turn-helix transcriptional regulator [Candidatus Saccharimonadales bacterium]|nr:helix-turn-helix transcriptional regulator [Candidatus Saccharimonadales bacterium]
MNTTQNNTNDEAQAESAAEQLGRMLREARKKCGWTIAQLAEKIGRPREWLNRVELGYSDLGVQRPPSPADLESLARYLGSNLRSSLDDLLLLVGKAVADYNSLNPQRGDGRRRDGKVIQTEVIMGEAQIYQAMLRMLEEQHSDTILRHTGIWAHPSKHVSSIPEWLDYRRAVGQFLKKNPYALIKRAEYLWNSESFKIALDADRLLVESDDLNQNQNARIRFFKRNPLVLDVAIGQREAIIAIPQRSGFQSLSAALLIKDKAFVEALRSWFEEVVWDSEIPHENLDYSDWDKSVGKIKDMYNKRTYTRPKIE